MDELRRRLPAGGRGAARGDDEPESDRPAGAGARRPVLAVRRPGGLPALDRAHLSRQCFGDESLEAELLAMFRTQAPSLTEGIGEAAGSSPGLAADLAHRLKGSALAVGAARVGGAAARVEACGRGGAEGPAEAAKMSQAVSELRGAVSEAVAEIERLTR